MLAMTSIPMMMIPSLGMITKMRTSMVLDVLEKWLPIGMARVVLELLMVPKWEVRNCKVIYYAMVLLGRGLPLIATETAMWLKLYYFCSVSSIGLCK